MVGKIIRIKDDFDIKYIKIKEEDENSYTGYGYITYNYFTGYYISKSMTVDKDVQFEIIDEIIFNYAFDQMINNMRYAHMQEMW